MVVTYPNSPYELHQPFQPAGDQPEAIAKLVEGLHDGLSFQTLLGVTGSGKTFTMANLVERVQKPTLTVMGRPWESKAALVASPPRTGRPAAGRR